MTDQLILLGVAGGAETAVVQTSPARARHGISSALVIEDRIYIVDAGASSARQLTLADPLGTGRRSVMRGMQAFFISHLHSDHTMDLANYPLLGALQGWPDRSVPVFGPWSRTIEPADYPRAQFLQEPIVAPGTAEFVRRLLHAYEADTLDRSLSSGKSFTLLDRMHGVDIEPGPGVNPDRATGELVPAWQIYEDDRVRVSTTLVAHGAMYPALGYRFETETCTVVFSGDTGPSENLIAMASGADYLVHEIIDPRFATEVYGDQPLTPEQQRSVDHVLAKHSAPADVGRVAQEAGVGTLVLAHLAPGHVPASYWAEVVTGFDGPVVVGDDLLSFDLG